MVFSTCFNKSTTTSEFGIKDRFKLAHTFTLKSLKLTNFLSDCTMSDQ